MSRKISFEQAGNVHRSVKQIFAYDAVGDAAFVREVWVYDADGNPQQVHPQVAAYPVGIAQSRNEAYDPLLTRILVQGTMTAADSGFFTGWNKNTFLGSMTNQIFSAYGINWTIWSLWSRNDTNGIVLEVKPNAFHSGPAPVPSEMFRQIWVPGDSGNSLTLTTSSESGMTYLWTSSPQSLRMEWPYSFKFVAAAQYTYSMRKY